MTGTTPTETDLRPSHRRILNRSTGHVLRITCWAAGFRRRDVFLVMPDGSLVELGHVVTLGGRSCMAFRATGDPNRGWGCHRFEAGARILGDRLEVTTLTLHTVSRRMEN